MLSSGGAGTRRYHNKQSGGTRMGLNRVMAGLVRMYQRWYPHPPYRQCGYEPTCSEYAVIAFTKYGFITAVKKTARRLRSCDGSYPVIRDDP